MRNFADTGYLHARICALKSFLLTSADYSRLIQEQPAGGVASDRDAVSPRDKMFREQIAPVLALVPACDRYAGLFLAFLRVYEAQNIKTLIANARGVPTLQQWYDIAPFAVAPKAFLEKNLSVEELKTFFAGTYLSRIFAGSLSPLQLPVRLDVFAARRLYASGDAFSGEARKDFRAMALERLEVVAAMWAYRLREYYGADDRQVRSFTEKLRRFADGPKTFGARLTEELNRYLEQETKNAGSKPTPAQIERYLEKNFYARMSSWFHRDFHSVSCVAAYLWLLYYQIRNLFCIMDGRRFGLSAEAIAEGLIGKS